MDSKATVEMDNAAKEILGMKFDDDKPRWELLPYEEMEDIVKVLTFGAKKYDDDNWQRVEPFNKRYFGAFMRHLIAWWTGKKKDPQSGMSHLAHAACNLLFLMWGEKHGK